MKWLMMIVVVGVVVLAGISVAGSYGGGTGTAEDSYQIWTAEQMNEIGLHEGDWGSHFKLMGDIDLSVYTGTQFNIIGYWNSDEVNAAFTGVFDGNGYTISNFSWHSTDIDDVGLFAWVNGGEIKNVGMIDPNVITENAQTDTASLVGYLGYEEGGTIAHCYVKGGSVSAKGTASVGGLCGHNYDGTISNSYSECLVTGEV